MQSKQSMVKEFSFISWLCKPYPTIKRIIPKPCKSHVDISLMSLYYTTYETKLKWTQLGNHDRDFSFDLSRWLFLWIHYPWYTREFLPIVDSPLSSFPLFLAHQVWLLSRTVFFSFLTFQSIFWNCHACLQKSALLVG